MATEVQNRNDQSLTGLVSGIVSDFQDLVKQQLTLTRTEITDDLRKTKDAGSVLVVGILILLTSATPLCLMLAHLLHWGWSPAGTDPATVPLWGCYAIIGGLLAVIGAVVTYAGKKKFDSFNPLPEQSMKGLQENLEWKTNNNPK